MEMELGMGCPPATCPRLGTAQPAAGSAASSMDLIGGRWFLLALLAVYAGKEGRPAFGRFSSDVRKIVQKAGSEAGAGISPTRSLQPPEGQRMRRCLGAARALLRTTDRSVPAPQPRRGHGERCEAGSGPAIDLLVPRGSPSARLSPAWSLPKHRPPSPAGRKGAGSIQPLGRAASSLQTRALRGRRT